MVPRSYGGGRNVNPGQADEVFGEHGGPGRSTSLRLSPRSTGGFSGLLHSSPKPSSNGTDSPAGGSTWSDGRVRFQTEVSPSRACRSGGAENDFNQSFSLHPQTSSPTGIAWSLPPTPLCPLHSSFSEGALPDLPLSGLHEQWRLSFRPRLHQHWASPKVPRNPPIPLLKRKRDSKSSHQIRVWCLFAQSRIRFWARFR
jgi:hypothetical protein